MRIPEQMNGAKDAFAMTDKLKESLSALMDNETDALEGRRVLKAAEQHAELDRAWDDYQLIGRVMRDGANAGLDLSSSIMEQIAEESEPAEHDNETSTLAWYQRWTGQVAVAAGVAAAVLVGLNIPQATVSPNQQIAQSSQTTIDLTPVGTNALALPATTFSQQAEPVAEQAPMNPALQAQLKAQIDAYLVRHAENAAASGSQGLLPMARVMRPQGEVSP